MYLKILLGLVILNFQLCYSFVLGSQNAFNSVVVQNDGKIVAAGFTIINNIKQFLIARFTENGVLDTTFGTGGCVATPIADNANAYNVKLDSSGNIIIAGSTKIGNVAYIVIARYLTNGTLDTSFGANGIVLTSLEQGSSCYSIIIESDDKITVTGSVLKNDEIWIPLVRYNTDGTLDVSFGTNGVTIVELEDCAIAYSLTKTGAGKYIMVGFAEGQSFVVQANADGSIDTSFGTAGGTLIPVNFSSSLKGSALQSSGKIIVGGYSEGNCLLIRLNADGTIDNTFGDSGIVLTQFGAYNAILELFIDSLDRIAVVGVADDNAIVARFTIDGILDNTFGNKGLVSIICGFEGNANAITFEPDQDIIIGGFSDNNGLIARLSSSGIFDSNFGINGLVLDPTDYFPTCVEDSLGSLNAYVFAYDTTNQTVSVANSFQDVTFNTNSQLLNWAHSSGTATFTCNKTGVYEITYTIASEKTSGSGLISGSLRLVKNGTEIPGSQQVIEYATNNQTMVQSKTLIATFTQGDVLKLQYGGSSTTCRLIAGDGIGSVRPSAAISVAQLS